MWKQLMDFGKQILSLAHKSQQHETDIDQHEEEIKQLHQKHDKNTDLLKQVLFEFDRERELAKRDRELLQLQLENTLLRHEQRLPPGENRVAELQRENEALRQRIAELDARIRELEK